MSSTAKATPTGSHDSHAPSTPKTKKSDSSKKLYAAIVIVILFLFAIIAYNWESTPEPSKTSSDRYTYISYVNFNRLPNSNETIIMNLDNKMPKHENVILAGGYNFGWLPIEGKVKLYCTENDETYTLGKDVINTEMYHHFKVWSPDGGKLKFCYVNPI